MQSERVRVLVGNPKDSFDVPYDLLAQYSTNFKKLRNALNDSGDEIVLADVTKPTFEDFFIWLHAYEPSIVRDENLDNEHIDRALKLAVFAQKYQIYHLRNQASDVVRVALLDEQWNITPDMISAVYKVAPAGSVLRQLSFLGFVAAEGKNDLAVWQGAFKDCPDLGWDYFQYKSGSDAYSEGIECGGACRFHDHSDIRDWVLQDVIECPYPHGAPRLIPEEVVPTPVPAPVVYDIDVQGGVNTPHAEEMNGTMPTVPEAEEAESEEAQPAEEPLPEPGVEQPPGTECWASETTETEPVEKFEPQEQPLPEETNVETWMSRTNQADPVEEPAVEESTAEESGPAEKEPLFVVVGDAHMFVDKDMQAVSKLTLTRIENKTTVEKEGPGVEERHVTAQTPASEKADPVDDPSSSQMERVGSVDQLSPNQKKNRKKRAKKGGQAGQP
jgi:hypothetical protein